MNHKNKNEFKILSFNVEGLKSKLEDPSFIELIEKFDISILSETWKGTTTKLNLEGFWDFSQIRPKHANAIRHSGGITILVKNTVRPGVRIEENSEGFIWLCLKKNIF